MSAVNIPALLTMILIYGILLYSTYTGGNPKH